MKTLNLGLDFQKVSHSLYVVGLQVPVSTKARWSFSDECWVMLCSVGVETYHRKSFFIGLVQLAELHCWVPPGSLDYLFWMLERFRSEFSLMGRALNLIKLWLVASVPSVPLLNQYFLQAHHFWWLQGCGPSDADDNFYPLILYKATSSIAKASP